MCARLEGWAWNRLLDMLTSGCPCQIAAILLYMPFYFGFASQAGGLLPNLVSPTRGAQLWVMFAPLFIPLLSYHAYLLRGDRRTGKWRLALLLALALVIVLLAAALLVAWIAALREPGLVDGFLSAQGVPDYGALLRPALLRRLMFIGGLLTMLAIFVPALAYLAAMKTETPAHVEVPAAPALR